MDIALDHNALEALFYLPDNDGAFAEPLSSYLGALGARRPSIVLAFPPKAAGTFLRAAALKAVDGQLVRVVHAQGARDAQPYLPTFVAYYHGGVCDGPLVTHIHMQAFPANISFLEALNIRPVIMIRNLPDMLASYWDMLESTDSALRQGLNCTIPAGFRDMTADGKADFMVDVLGPWYAGYYATWLDYAERQPERVCVLRYGDFLREPARLLEMLLRHTGFSRTQDQCQAAIEAVWPKRHALRFNRGTEGRGARYFSERHRASLLRMLDYYPATAARSGELIGSRHAV